MGLPITTGLEGLTPFPRCPQRSWGWARALPQSFQGGDLRLGCHGSRPTPGTTPTGPRQLEATTARASGRRVQRPAQTLTSNLSSLDPHMSCRWSP